MKVFLSHAHADAADALSLAAELRVRLADTKSLEIFCTSKPEDSLPDPSRYIRPGENWEVAMRAAMEKLRDFLRENMMESRAYLLLITRRSLEYSRPWIRWEMLEAQKMADERGLKFIPCLLDVPVSALTSMVTARISSRWGELEAGAIPNSALRPYEYQAVDISSPAGLQDLARAVV
jgi:TIR domain